MPVGVVKSVKPGQPYREITLDPSGMARSPDDVLIVVEGVHQEIPDTPPANQQVYLAPAPPPLAEPAGIAAAATPADGSAPAHQVPGTEADRARAMYQKAADSEDIVLGGGATGQNIKRPPDFTKLPVDPRTALQGTALQGPEIQGTLQGRGAAAAPPVTPMQKKGTASPGPANPGPAKGTGPADLKTTPDAVRRANQAAGGPGGKPQP
jgi:rod shape-determining protein MreC